MDDIAIILQDSLRTELGILPKDYSVSARSGMENQVSTRMRATDMYSDSRSCS
jgi:hypothetical protein